MNLKSISLLLLPAAFMLVMVACGGTPQPTPAPTPDIEATVEARIQEKLVEAEPEITQAGAALLSAIAKWHLRYGERGLTGYEREDMVSELIDLAEPAGNLLEEPLALRIENYMFNHMLFTMVKSNTAFRAGLFSIDSGLGDSMPSPCSLPEANAVPEELQKDLLLLMSECQAQGLFEIYLSQTRSLAAETWLRPFIDRVIAP